MPVKKAQTKLPTTTNTKRVNPKVAYTQAGLSLFYNSKYHPCDGITACLFLGNDDHTMAYCAIGAKLPNTYAGLTNGEESWLNDIEYHIIEEITGKLSDSFVNETAGFLNKHKVERVIVVCADIDLRNRVRKELGCKVIWGEEKRRNNYSIILREWFSRTKRNGDDPILKIWSCCHEAVRSNYPPARDCMVRILEWFDLRRKANRAVLKTRVTAGYR